MKYVVGVRSYEDSYQVYDTLIKAQTAYEEEKEYKNYHVFIAVMLEETTD